MVGLVNVHVMLLLFEVPPAGNVNVAIVAKVKDMISQRKQVKWLLKVLDTMLLFSFIGRGLQWDN